MVSPQAYYRWKARQNSLAAYDHLKLLEQVRQIANQNHFTYGSRRIRAALEQSGISVGRCRSKTLMKQAGVTVRYRKPYKVTTNSTHRNRTYPNLLAQNFKVSQINQVWVSDITYLRTSEGWLYLAVVIDLYSRKVVGWALSERINASLVCNALQQAIDLRRPGKGLIHHSDRGSQYASNAYRNLLEKYDITGSMSGKGNCYDNAVAESFFATLKNERVWFRRYDSRAQARIDIVDYISMYYNCTRLHSTLGYLSPDRFENRNNNDLKIAA